MNRTTKFRGKRIDDGSWVYGNLFNWYRRTAVIPIIGDGVRNGSIIGNEVDPETVGEFTGLLDKNGEEIYEGDVLNNEFGGIWAVRFNKDGFWECYDDPNGGYFLSDYLKSSAIISNIHDNPELLNTNKVGEK